jgi:hypothetical protein
MVRAGKSVLAFSRNWLVRTAAVEKQNTRQGPLYLHGEFQPDRLLRSRDNVTTSLRIKSDFGRFHNKLN